MCFDQVKCVFQGEGGVKLFKIASLYQEWVCNVSPHTKQCLTVVLRIGGAIAAKWEQVALHDTCWFTFECFTYTTYEYFSYNYNYLLL